MAKWAWSALLAAVLWSGLGPASAQSLPVNVTISGNEASAYVGLPGLTILDLSLEFENAQGLSANSLGIGAKVVSPLSPLLQGRLPNLNLTSLTAALPVLITVEPPANGGLRFQGTGRFELHTHVLPYALGSSLRLFKAPLGGPFQDITDEIAQGSVRARGTYGGFSQFLILIDLRPTGMVIDEKILRLRNRVALLPVALRPAYTTLLDDAEDALDDDDYPAAIAAVDGIRSLAQSQAGTTLSNEWRADHSTTNHAGELIAGAATLRFSVIYQRDYGQ
ncbi:MULTISPECIES: DUF6689 family protein [unclassified Lysobacter]|uniref:DUF6689 family protein n=1 Tax=unclassified Lysobacter TaxID=2635362 RepID=UPI0006F5D97C|nr:MULTISPECIES: DUF6689 family protein [unclassified Lysobacter]KRA15399.1 hypothetical protein ASD69_18220 [Lysobacter sp. Root604]KRD80353.1 hypothetical protein ASE43_05685 [Lysobacter sp. Root983]